MAADKTVFYGFGAWVGVQSGPTTCGWFPDDPATMHPPFDPTKLIDNNLADNPDAVRRGVLPIHKLQVDDTPRTGGQTKIGPSFPNGTMIGGVWLTKEVFENLPAPVRPPRVQRDMECHAYELTTVIYWTGAMANRRFWGFHAEINSSKNSSALVSIWQAGASLQRGAIPVTTVWLDLTTQAHPIAAGFTTIGVGPNDPKIGALFLDAATVGGLSLSGPKIPRAQGGENHLREPYRR